MQLGKNNILEASISELPFSQELKDWMANNDFEKLNDLIRHSTSELLSLEGFGYRFLREIYSFLEKNNMQQFLKQS